MTEPGLRCIEVVELVSDYLDGKLDADTRVRVEEHLTLCPHCQVYVEQVRDTVRALQRLPVNELPEQAVSELETAFADFHRRRP